jgi:hypothetical protein
MVDEGLYSIALSSVLDVAILPVYEDEIRTMGYYTHELHEESSNILLSFENPVSIKNEGDLNQVLNNEFGSFTLSFRQVKENAILISSKYFIKNEFLPAENYHFLIELNNKVKEIMDIELFIGE